MIWIFIKKQKEKKNKVKILRTMIISLNIHETQKEMYLNALDIINENEFENLYRDISNFIDEIEIKEIKDIQKGNFVEIAWMRKKEAVEKQKDINAFSFLINNL